MRRALIGIFAVLLLGAIGFGVGLGTGGSVRQSTTAGALRSASLPSATPRTFESADSAHLAGTQLVVQSRGTVVLVHGLGEPDSLFNQWALALNAATGMNVLGVALRGNGASRDSVGRGDRPEQYAADIGAALSELKRRQPSGPIILLSTHGGLGIAAAYLRRRSTLRLPQPDGIIALEVDTTGSWRVANGRPIIIKARRLRTLDLLADWGVSLGNGLDVVMQESSGRELTTRWSYRAWRSAEARMALLLDAHQGLPIPLLVVSSREEPKGLPRNAERTWSVVARPVDPNAPSVVTAIARFSAAFAADAYEPTPPKATRTLEVLPVK